MCQDQDLEKVVLCHLETNVTELGNIKRTGYTHGLSVLSIRRTMQINSRPIEIIIYFWKQSGDLRR